MGEVGAMGHPHQVGEGEPEEEEVLLFHLYQNY
jgi:hypothetical protein